MASHYIGPSRAVHHSDKGEWLAVGLNNGSFMVISTASYKCIAKKRDRGSMVTVVKWVTGVGMGYYTPCNSCSGYYKVVQGNDGKLGNNVS